MHKLGGKKDACMLIHGTMILNHLISLVTASWFHVCADGITLPAHRLLGPSDSRPACQETCGEQCQVLDAHKEQTVVPGSNPTASLTANFPSRPSTPLVRPMGCGALSAVELVTCHDSIRVSGNVTASSRRSWTKRSFRSSHVIDRH